MNIRIKDIVLPEILKQDSTKLKTFVNRYVFDKIKPRVLQSIRELKAQDVYGFTDSKLNYETGKIGRAMSPILSKINQYSFSTGVNFDDTSVPYIRTNIGNVSPGRVTIRSRKKFMTVPVEGSAADVKGRRLSLRDFPGIKVGFGKKSKKPFWYRGRWDKKKPFGGVEMLFIGRKAVRPRQKININTLSDAYRKKIEPRIFSLANEAIREFYKQ